MRVLIVLTSHAQLGESGDKTGFWLAEFTTPYYIFKDAGAKITLASPVGQKPPLDPKSTTPEFQTNSTQRFNADPKAQYAITNTVELDKIHANDYDAVFYPGGHGPLWDLAENKNSTQLIETLYAAGKPVSAVCHAPCVFRHAKNLDGTPIVNNKKVTSFTNAEESAVQLVGVVPFLVEDMLRENGAVFSCADNFVAHTVIDGNLITGQNPASSTAVATAVLDLCKQENRN